jgi:glycosyltransferase involved in cell wall biosynthesis
MEKLLTIIIPCRNEGSYIRKTLQSISKQKGIGNTKIIIADANSTDNTLFEIESSKFYYDLNIEVIGGGTVSVGRNKGASVSKTPYILFLDADTELLSDDILIKGLEELTSNKYYLVTGKVRSVSKSILSKLVFRVFTFVQHHILPETFCTGQFFMISRVRFLSLRGFDEEVRHSEDYLLSRKIERSRFKILNKYIGQDDRRFKKMGYFVFFWFLIKNYINKNNREWFTNDVGYWL